MPLNTRLVVRLSMRGCRNRPFYHLVVMKQHQARDKGCTDQIGSYDPLPNVHNEKLVAIDFKKLRYWVQKGATFSTPVLNLLGFAGYFPIHPRTRLAAYRVKKKLEEEKAKTQSESDKQTAESENS